MVGGLTRAWLRWWPDMWTKTLLIEEAFGELALAGYVYDLRPEEMQAAGRRLETMMATWAAAGRVVPYSFAGETDGIDLTADSGVPLSAVEAVYLSLAIRIAGSKGKQVSQTTKSTARAALDALDGQIARRNIVQQQFRVDTPQGAGAKTWRTTRAPYLPTPDTGAIQLAPGGGLTFDQG